MVELVKSRLTLNGSETLVDAYAGVGTFSILMAPHVRRVIAIEESESAIGDAAINAIGLNNLEFKQGKILFTKLLGKHCHKLFQKVMTFT